MDFRETQAIYLQIVEWICEQIILQVWNTGDKIPSVRELAVELEVNPNTIARTYEQLQSMELVVNKRGIGLFVADHSKDKAIAYLKKQFIEKNLPQMFNYIKLLNISMEELNNLYHTFTQNNRNHETNKEKHPFSSDLYHSGSGIHFLYNKFCIFNSE